MPPSRQRMVILPRPHRFRRRGLLHSGSLASPQRVLQFKPLHPSERQWDGSEDAPVPNRLFSALRIREPAGQQRLLILQIKE